jgi:threonine/homoserine/homoserine lactone efflux protein
MTTLLAVVGEQFPVWFTFVYVIGAAVMIFVSMVAFYNSKRPTGWEASRRPGFIPDLSGKADRRPSESEPG